MDINGHMNNARYFDLAEDCIPPAAWGEKLTGIQVEYQSEARFGDRLNISWGCSGSSYYISGEGETPVFRMELRYG